MAVKRRVILYISITIWVILYIRTYIYTRTKLVPWIDQVYKQILLEKTIQLQLTAQVYNMFWPENSPIFLSPTPIDKRTQSGSRTRGQREIFFPFFCSFIWPLLYNICIKKWRKRSNLVWDSLVASYAIPKRWFVSGVADYPLISSGMSSSFFPM